jgi:FdrA protein
MPSVRVANIVMKGLYRDSVQLMELTEHVKRINGVVDAAILMATKGNKEFLKSLGLLTPEGEAADSNDVLIALKAEGDLERLLEIVKEMLHRGGGPSMRRKSLDDALSEGADFAVISVPGRYVGEIASRFLVGGVNLFIFSDHVPVDVEVSLKNLGRRKGLLVLGPEAGTSLIGGVGLGFANNVRRGVVGIVASAGSGIQELTTILDAMGVGVSHALGVGGRDLTDEVGGIMTEESLKILDNDSGTRMIALLAKQSDKETVRKVLETIRLSKPLLVTLLGEERSSLGDITNIPTIHGLALRICSLVSPANYSRYAGMVREEAGHLRKASAVKGYPRGFYCGGTLATETAYIWKWAGLEVATNMRLPWTRKLRDSRTSEHATIVDYGDEEFTEGRPHPIIDPTLRNQRIVSEIGSDDTAAITMDLIIGYGAPENIVGKTVEQIGEALRSHPEKRVVVRVVGTPSDIQWSQVSLLESLPVIRVSSNALAAAYTASAGLGNPDIIEDVVEELIIFEG